MKDRELLERLRKVESIPVKVYGQDGETICFEVQVGLAGVMVPGKGSVESTTPDLALWEQIGARRT